MIVPVHTRNELSIYRELICQAENRASRDFGGARFIVLQTNTIIFERSVFMATSVMQVRVDDDLRAKAAAVYDELGIDLPTAIISFAP